MSNPTLSVVMPNYNHARFIPEALGAILSQSYRPLEIIILDDGSTDNSVEVIERYREQAPDIVKVLRNDKNMGLLANGPRLLSMVRGDFVFFSAMDDRILPGFFERSMRLLSRHPKAGLCSTLCGIMDEQGVSQGLVKLPIVIRREGFIEPADVLRLMRRHGNWFMGNTTIFNTRAIREIEGFRPELGPYCDGFASLVIAAQHGACFIPEPLAVWRRMESTYSGTFYADIQTGARVLECAEMLMRGKFVDIFPAAHVNVWRREMVYGLASTLATQQVCDFADVAQLAPPANWIDRTLDEIARRSGAVGRAMAKPYLFLRFRRPLWRMILRRLEYLRLTSRWRAAHE